MRTSTVLLVLSCFPIAGVLAQSGSGGDYTKAQATAGKQVYDQTCAVCHGDHLQGGVGPSLAGQQFLSVSQHQKISAEYFYHFMSTHMPFEVDPTYGTILARCLATAPVRLPSFLLSS